MKTYQNINILMINICDVYHNMLHFERLYLEAKYAMKIWSWGIFDILLVFVHL